MLPGERRPQSIDGFHKSYALIPEKSRTAVVFVHGFAGSPTGTWHDFHHLSREYAPEFPWWDTAALFFYKYDSTRTPIRVNATRLRDFITVILGPPTEPRPEGDDAPGASADNQPGRTYESLVLAGHSEGAVVIRRMVLDRVEALVKRGHKQRLTGPELAQWVEGQAAGDQILSSRLYLFAPACAGTNFSGFLGFMHGVSGFFSAIASSSLVRNELVKGSPILENLHTGTDRAHDTYDGIRAVPAKVLFGDHDQVVYTEIYTCDDMEEPFAIGHDHFSVCKPRYVYKRPLGFVRP
jgi:hypothetical protein